MSLAARPDRVLGAGLEENRTTLALSSNVIVAPLRATQRANEAMPVEPVRPCEPASRVRKRQPNQTRSAAPSAPRPAAPAPPPAPHASIQRAAIAGGAAGDLHHDWNVGLEDTLEVFRQVSTP